ncbi:LIF receptor subunit alpha a [Oryzias melastigma]|uniref:LIF receptor subunit alpha a n=1 Tax=Oryzias melastigma TaxID=30732 RepID=A0A3B3CK46_ORYME|nr:LIF receptor subunit alpha a [Oryzias melastigma]
MSQLILRHTLKPKCSLPWLIYALVNLLALNTNSQTVLTVPKQVSLSANSSVRELTISWFGGSASTFDLIILRTEFNTTVFYDTISAIINHASGRHEWKWTSAEPLECTSLSVRIRSRDGHATSEWSETDTLPGRDLPSINALQMYPLDSVVEVGSNVTFCCIVEEGKTFKDMLYGKTVVTSTRLSRRSYASTVVNVKPTNLSGSNVVCRLNDLSLTGAVMFVGYPPLPSDFVCETQDLISAVCHWKEARDSHLNGGRRKTRYSVNSRKCDVDRLPLTCSLPLWDGNWTLMAVNNLGHYSLSDSAELSHRVRPVAPIGLSSIVHAWNATLMWEWTSEGYHTLDLNCQVEFTNDQSKPRNFSGVGLRSVLLSGLYPDEAYTVRVRCGAQKYFWKWGDWSQTLSFKTKPDVSDAPDVWMWMNKDKTGLVVWKPLSHHQSHGQITGYEVTLWNPEDVEQHTQILPPNTYSVQVNLREMASVGVDKKVFATVIIKTITGASPPSRVPLQFIDEEPSALSKCVFNNSRISLFWQHSASNTCNYLVEWLDASCEHDCPVKWIRVAAGSTNLSIESENFQPGVRYNFSLYSCPSDSPQLIKRWQGYTQELVPSRSVPLSVKSQDSDVVITWGEIPLSERRGFVLGYNVYISNGSELTLLANLSSGGMRRHIVKGLSAGTYKFTVKAYTSAGEDTGTTASVKLEPFTDALILEMLGVLGIITVLLVIVTFICYKKRKWVKKAFYPEIPEPKLPGDWSRPQGPLDVRPSPHSMVHIVDKPERDLNKEALVVIPEEEEYFEKDEPVDTDEPMSLRYYNQVVDDRPIRPRFPDSSASSASSLDSAHTDVTYTGIQTSGSSLVFQPDPQGSSEERPPEVVHYDGGYKPQMHPKVLSDDAGLKPSNPFHEPEAASSVGYKPQCSWHLDSPTDAETGSLAPSLGSPTSIASTQFLLPDGDEDEKNKQQLSSSAATWFSNLLLSSKP